MVNVSSSCSRQDNFTCVSISFCSAMRDSRPSANGIRNGLMKDSPYSSTPQLNDDAISSDFSVADSCKLRVAGIADFFLFFCRRLQQEHTYNITLKWKHSSTKNSAICLLTQNPHGSRFIQSGHFLFRKWLFQWPKRCKIISAFGSDLRSFCPGHRDFAWEWLAYIGRIVTRI